MKPIKIVTLSTIIVIIMICGIIYYQLPIKRVGIKSELIMLGDFDNNNKWDDEDLKLLEKFLKGPFVFSNTTAIKFDINKNNYIDKEGIEFLRQLYKYSDPYEAANKWHNIKKTIYPRPRELFRYIPITEYIQRPVYILKNKIISKAPFEFIKHLELPKEVSSYKDKLLCEIYDETIRLILAYNKRKLNKIEQDYAINKFKYCDNLYNQRDYYNLLLYLISLVEDAETLTIDGQEYFVGKILYFREHLRTIITSDSYAKFKNSEIDYKTIFNEIEKYLKEDLSIELRLDQISSPRDFLNIENYVERSEWQYYKTTTIKSDFQKLLLYAQYDRRYLRCVSKTNPKHEDVELLNHNLPMILLFRQALNIKNNNKKAAVGGTWWTLYTYLTNYAQDKLGGRRKQIISNFPPKFFYPLQIYSVNIAPIDSAKVRI